MYTGMKTQPSINRTNKAFNSNPATAMPEFAALPLSPGNKTKFYVVLTKYASATKTSNFISNNTLPINREVPIHEAKRDAPIF